MLLMYSPNNQIQKKMQSEREHASMRELPSSGAGSGADKSEDLNYDSVYPDTEGNL